MPYRDQYVTCSSCGEQFVYRVEEQRQAQQTGLELIVPELCPTCKFAAPGLREGVIKRIHEDKHYGFISQQIGDDVFFHRSDVEGDVEATMVENAPVWYEIIVTDRGLKAVNIQLKE